MVILIIILFIMVDNNYGLETFSFMKDRKENLIADLVSRQRREAQNTSSGGRNTANNSDTRIALGMMHLPKVEITKFAILHQVFSLPSRGGDR